jgi:glycine/D-amino acid oxidase-like deaminating enzyme
VIAAGPWARELLPPALSARLTLLRQTVVYCSVPKRLQAAWTATPAIASLGDPDGVWALPPVAGTPLKLSAAAACRPATRLGGHRAARAQRHHLVARLAQRIVGLDTSWVSRARDFHYLAHASTGGPLLARLDGGAVWSFAACGGTSFKFAPLVAQALAAHVLDEPQAVHPETPYTTTSWSRP